jgi:predicted transcriptional regulator
MAEIDDTGFSSSFEPANNISSAFNKGDKICDIIFRYIKATTSIDKLIHKEIAYDFCINYKNIMEYIKILIHPENVKKKRMSSRLSLSTKKLYSIGDKRTPYTNVTVFLEEMAQDEYKKMFKYYRLFDKKHSDLSNFYTYLELEFDKLITNIVNNQTDENIFETFYNKIIEISKDYISFNYRDIKQLVYFIYTTDRIRLGYNTDRSTGRVQGGKKSSEYIDYKFQNKIYRRKIRYEGKKKYIILNKQKVFIKNKK